MNRKNDHKKITLTLPKNSFDRSEKQDVKLVQEIVENLTGQYQPLEPIKGLKIVL